MGKKYKHLTWSNRLQIERLLRLGYKPTQIAEIIGCCRATIYNEIKRATYIHHSGDFWKEEVRYSPDLAQERYERNMRKKGKSPKILEDPQLHAFLEHKILNEKYSPQAALLYIKNEGLEFGTDILSVNTLYNYIKKGMFEGITMANCPYRKDRRRKDKVQRRKIKTISGRSIEERPEHIDSRETFGHWEMDTVKGKATNRKCLLVLTERKTRYEYIEVMKSCSKDETVKALNRIEKAMGSSFFKVFKTITCDNGAEFRNYEGIEKALYRVGKRTELYYCHPYSSCERGSNENQNKLIRRHYPKGSDFDKIIDKKKVKKVEAWINDYPRAMFKGLTSKQLYEKELLELGIS